MHVYIHIHLSLYIYIYIYIYAYTHMYRLVVEEPRRALRAAAARALAPEHPLDPLLTIM